MGFLFLDIESFVAKENEKSGLNPHHSQSEILVIAYNYYDLKKAPFASQIKKPSFLYIWEEDGEKEMLLKFFDLIEKIYEEDDFLKIVGFNHLAYDLPYLFSRAVYHKILDEKRLFDLLFTDARHIDLSQLAMAISNNTKRDEDFRCISQKVINSYFDIPIKEADGKDVSRFYEDKRYDLIEKYVTEEFTFELLYRSILDYFIYVN